MNYTRIHFEKDIHPARHFQAGASVHGHTLHSRESLDFVYKFVRGLWPAGIALDRAAARYRKRHGAALELSRGWWTPPLSPQQAWKVEAAQIERLQMKALISLSDHDNIDAPMNLQLIEETRSTPVSVEWTVPYDGTFFHIGVHNMPGGRARRTMAALSAYTSGQPGPSLRELFAELASEPGILIVFNHPYWDEKGIGQEAHRAAVRKFANAFKPYLHAFELNGLRPWPENRTILDLARAFEKPLIAGGDRHASEPNTLLNLTNASTFAEFVGEIRDGISDVFVTNQYLEPLPMRILRSLEEILGRREDHAYGWTTWSDRAFYICDDGVTRSLKQAWGEEPAAIRLFTKGVDMLRNPRFQQAFRLAFARRQEVVL